MSTERAAPLDADLEEDTDLPPPAPGLRSPIADHSFDPPTLPGIVAPHRIVPLSDRAFEREHNSPTHDLPAHLQSQRRPEPRIAPVAEFSGFDETAATGAEALEWEPLPQRIAGPAYELPIEHTLRMQAPLLPLLLQPAPPPESGSPAALPPLPPSSLTPTLGDSYRSEPTESRRGGTQTTQLLPQIGHLPPLPPSSLTPTLGDSYRSEPTESRLAYTQTTQTLPEISHLPPLPPTPEHDSLLAGLRYSRAVFRGLSKRRRLQEQLRVSERSDLDALDRALVRLGQRAYTDHLDLLDWHPLFAGGSLAASGELSLSLEARLQQRAERAAARLQAQAQKEVATLRHREAALESELRQCGRVLRQRQSDLFALDRRTRGVPAFHPLHFQHNEAESAAKKTQGEVNELAQHLGQARAARLVHERIYSHAQPPIDQLAVALSPKLAAAQRRSPHLLVLGALLASAGIGVEPPGTAAASYTSLWQRITQLQTNLALRQTLFARLGLDRQTYDRDAIRRALLTLGVIILALLGGAAVVLVWMLMR